MARGVVRMASSMGWRRGSRIMRRAKADVHADVAPDEVARTGNRARMNWLETTTGALRMSLSQARSARALIAFALVLVLAACSSDSGSPSETTAAEATASPTASEAEATATAEATESADDSADATVVVADSDLGEILTDADGLTIYFFANDTEGVSNCEGDCLANWPPVEVDGEPSAGDGVDAELGTFERADGAVQLTVNGFPAYYFAGDSTAGDVNGQGVGGVWFVFGGGGEPIEG